VCCHAIGSRIPTSAVPDPRCPAVAQLGDSTHRLCMAWSQRTTLFPGNLPRRRRLTTGQVTCAWFLVIGRRLDVGPLGHYRLDWSSDWPHYVSRVEMVIPYYREVHLLLTSRIERFMV
jgi:hypothetical protein